MPAPLEAAQRNLYKRQWQVVGIGMIIVIISVIIRNDRIFAAGMTIGLFLPLLIKCPRCGKSIMWSFGTVAPRRTCPHCEWPKPE